MNDHACFFSFILITFLLAPGTEGIFLFLGLGAQNQRIEVECFLLHFNYSLKEIPNGRAVDVLALVVRERNNQVHIGSLS
jgi:hypothetical protein